MSAPPKIEVTLDDQRHINEFSKLNVRSHDYAALVKAKKKVLEDLEDASSELVLCDDEAIRYVAGECFINISKDSAEERLEKLGEKVKEEVGEYESKIGETSARMKELKALLYGKFGSSINLEE